MKEIDFPEFVGFQKLSTYIRQKNIDYWVVGLVNMDGKKSIDSIHSSKIEALNRCHKVLKALEARGFSVHVIRLENKRKYDGNEED